MNRQEKVAINILMEYISHNGCFPARDTENTV